MRKFVFWLMTAVIGLTLAGCEEQQSADIEPRIRAIKPYYVTDLAAGTVRQYAGTISPAETSALSFSVSGRVADLKVEQGQSVNAGDVLAVLETETYQLNLQASRSQLSSAIANRNDKKNTYDRHLQLSKKGWVTRAALQQAKAAYEASAGEVNLARARVGIAERDLEKTTLKAPFSGVIATKEIENFEEVTAGQTILMLNSKGVLDVDIAVPDILVSQIQLGMPVKVDVSVVEGCGCEGRLTEIGQASGVANTIPIKASLSRERADLLPGMAATVNITLAEGAEKRGYLVPLVAIAPGTDPKKGYIFKFDPDSGKLSRHAVRGGAATRDNLVEIVEGVEAGDIIAAAGVSFLRDGQIVKLLGND